MNNTNKLISGILLLCLFGAVDLSAQLSLELRTGFNDELCPGFSQDNEAVVDIRNMPPISPSSNTKVEFYWVLQHDEATWSWQTSLPARSFLVPFPGEYTLRCQVLYVSLENRHPYAAFWSSPMKINTGEECD